MLSRLLHALVRGARKPVIIFLALALLVALATGEPAVLGGAAIVMGVLGLLGGFLSCLVAGAGGLHAALAEMTVQALRFEEQHRFLCPACLRFDGFRFACAACGGELDSRILVYTGGLYLSDCPHCRLNLEPRHGGAGMVGFCRHCRSRCDSKLYHHRRVRVLGTLLPGDLDTLRRARVPHAGDRQARGMRFLCLDRAGQLTYFLSLCDSSGLLSCFPSSHAAFQVEALWLDVGNMEVLELGREVDRFFRRLDLPEGRLRTTEVHVPQDTLEAPARRLLEARFGVVRCGVPARRFLEGAGAGCERSIADGNHVSAVESMEKAALPAAASAPEEAARLRGRL